MVKKPPHLPPRSCNVELHRKLLSLPRLLVLVFLASLAGIAGALSTVAWIAPSVIPQGSFYAVDINQPIEQIEIDPLLRRQSAQKYLTVYDARDKIGNSFYVHDSAIFRAVILSSDGWAVAYYPDYLSGEQENWEVVDHQGIIHRVERLVPDPISGLLYFNISGEGFRIMGFDDWGNVVEQYPLWTMRDFEIEQAVVEKISERFQGRAFQIWQPRREYLLSEDLPVGSFLLNGSGELVGFVGDDNSIIMGWYVSEQIASIFDSARVRHTTLPVTGYLLNNVVVDGGLQSYSGFYITQSRTAAGPTSLGKNDIIIAINGQSLNELNLARYLFAAADPLRVKIIRQGREMEITVQKQPITP